MDLKRNSEPNQIVNSGAVEEGKMDDNKINQVFRRKCNR
jgi:hypothetical protein